MNHSGQDIKGNCVLDLSNTTFPILKLIMKKGFCRVSLKTMPHFERIVKEKREQTHVNIFSCNP